MEIEPNRVYTFDEVLEILQLSPVTLRKLVRRGEIPATKLGKRYRFLGSELLRTFEAKTAVDRITNTKRKEA